MKSLLRISFLFSLVACASYATDEGAKLASDSARLKNHSLNVGFRGTKGESLGTATLKPHASGGTEITLDLKGLSPGMKAFHVHETAKCEGPKFASAGDHFNPEGKEHGTANPQGSHAGD